mmetsp:Transcript_92424/g.266854  ORF Transcript_92424/g.266854 Transcript_92424/m.266854 type:complete len:640 (+) Transcript_92424:92-2011(+)|eukprot:CAMPEP_0176021778 /NCGR_PEP_ID=MMETSP0120_2-20121206/10584_1 /TAXON_ID=160619 /ORGANISM="Kryptoperidinium foliaceum, Strain CCMP 1326" /LENGTH=639 /DNA_ID=CAMNT_0017354901 /DNA_START=79 /DNA_END=1998 /DNA_ORIENTATION=-
MATAADLPKVHQPALAPFVRDEFLTRAELEKAKGTLMRNKALSLMNDKALANLGNVSVRDCMFLAFSLHEDGGDGHGSAQAAAIVNTVAKFFLKTAARFDDVIGGGADPRDPMSRPHMRFNGQRLEELGEYCNHKQNDALGYFIWLRCKLCVEDQMPMTGDHLRLLGLMLEYLLKIEYWRDEDAGHWEEGASVSSSSIGPVVAGVQQLQKLLKKYPGMMVPCRDGTLDVIEQKGKEALDATLPVECAQAGKERGVDAALLFLVYPLRVVSSDMAATIVNKVQEELLGHIGVRRFNGDSKWCKNFTALYGPEAGTRAWTDEDIAERDKQVVPGEEAQWCIFDPILSAIYGERYVESRDFEDLQRQQLHFFRSLAHVTGPNSSSGQWQCPECYSLRDGQWIPSNTGTSMWTQANLHLALHHMDCSLLISHKEVKAEFKKYDTGGAGTIPIEDLVTVLTKLNGDLPADQVAALLSDFAQEGGHISFEQLIDGLFTGSMTSAKKAALNIQGLRPPSELSLDEACEIERVLTETLLSLTGDFAGDYFPLPSSQSYPARIGGMTPQEAKALEKGGMLFEGAGEASGRGVFANSDFDVAVLVNANSHLELMVRPPLGDNEAGEARLRTLERVLRDSMRLQGYELTG